jgi:DNA-binding PadR family transcriptional regulator
MNPSVIYRALRDMEERGWVSSTWDKDRTQGPPRRICCLTALGNEMLAKSVKELKMTQDQIGYFLNAYRQGMEDKD